jgi:hypothetical protein
MLPIFFARHTFRRRTLEHLAWTRAATTTTDKPLDFIAARLYAIVLLQAAPG